VISYRGVDKQRVFKRNRLGKASTGGPISLRYIMELSVSREVAWDDRMVGETLTENNFKRSAHDLIEVILAFPWKEKQTNKLTNKEKFRFGQPVSRRIFEPSTSRIQVLKRYRCTNQFCRPNTKILLLDNTFSGLPPATQSPVNNELSSSIKGLNVGFRHCSKFKKLWLI
jgi:hypothetical protein